MIIETIRPAIGPLCAWWFATGPQHPEDPDACAHESCDRIAWRLPPAHDCPYEIFAADPISQHYGLSAADFVSCAVCDAAQVGRP
jgi:hypothetical protein